jgi:ABC-type Fe3+-hydroxamate transport system substrate-binding protein
MRECIDMLGRGVRVPHRVSRIVSLVPSQTDLLYHWLPADTIVGQTLFCVNPERQWAIDKSVGGTKKAHLDKIRQLQPDLIIANKEENDKEQIETLAQEFPVWVSDIKTLDDFATFATQIADVLHIPQKAEDFLQKLQNAKQSWPDFEGATCLYLIWKDPYMAAGKGTFIDSMLGELNLKNVIQEPRYPSLNEWNALPETPDIIMLSSEPYPFKKEHIEALEEQFPSAWVCLVDGEPFSWYGPPLLRLAETAKRLKAELDGAA